MDNFHPALAKFKCLLTRAFATLYTSKVGSKVDHEHAAGAAAKGTFATSRRLGNVRSSKVRFTSVFRAVSFGCHDIPHRPGPSPS